MARSPLGDRSTAARKMLSMIRGMPSAPPGEEDISIPPPEEAPPGVGGEAVPLEPEVPEGGAEAIEGLLAQVESSLEGVDPKRAQAVREHLNAIREILADVEAVPESTGSEGVPPVEGID